MAIKIITTPDIYLTQSEYDALAREYNAVIGYMVNPPSLEEWIERRKKPTHSGSKV